MGIEKFDIGLLMEQLKYQENLVDIGLVSIRNNNSELKKKAIELGLFDGEEEIDFFGVVN